MITLTSSWHSARLGCTFPAGTVFIPQYGRLWSYGTPDGGFGECLFDVGVVPGAE